MSRFKINVKVELVECDNSEQDGLAKRPEGGFSMTITEQDAISIDKVESSVLRTAYPTIREAVSKHLTEMSKKKLVKKVEKE